MADSPSDNPGPYRVERVETDDGPAWRLTGPGLDHAKLYAWEEVREKLTEMAHLMNFAYAQALKQNPVDDAGR
jgi:hypothetical protein